jgi:hypothetical protein
VWAHSVRHVAKATGATILLTLADMDGNETFDPAALGSADEVCPRVFLKLEFKNV